jgi:hypothetical protein
MMEPSNYPSLEELSREFDLYQRGDGDGASQLNRATMLLRRNYPLMTNFELYNCDPQVSQCTEMGKALQRSIHVESVVLPVGSLDTDQHEHDEALDALLEFVAAPPNSLKFVTLDDSSHNNNSGRRATENTTVHRFLEAMQASPNNIFFLSLCCVKDLSAESLVDVLANHSALQHLSLSTVELSTESLTDPSTHERLAAAFATCHLRALNLHGTSWVATHIGRCESLQRIHISDTDHPDRMVISLSVKALLETQGSHLSQLDFEDLVFDADQLSPIVDGLEACGRTIEITFNNCQTPTTAAGTWRRFLYGSVAAAKITLLLQEFSWTESIGSEGTCPVSSIVFDLLGPQDLHATQALRVYLLDLQFDQGDPTRMGQLFDTLNPKTCRLQRLSLRSMSQESITGLSKFLSHSVRLQELTVSSSTLLMGSSGRFPEELMNAFNSNRSLRYVHFDDRANIHPQDLAFIDQLTTRNRNASVLLSPGLQCRVEVEVNEAPRAMDEDEARRDVDMIPLIAPLADIVDTHTSLTSSKADKAGVDRRSSSTSISGGKRKSEDQGGKEANAKTQTSQQLNERTINQYRTEFTSYNN